jgi:hypothetical protein
MSSKFLAVTAAISLGLLSACSSESEITPEIIEVTRIAVVTKEVTREVEVEVEVEVTRIVEVPVTVTFTPGPSPTPTETLTPTVTRTSTPTPTPFRTSGCVNLRSVANFWNIEKADADEKLFPTYDSLDGKCVKFYGSQSLGIVTTDFGWISLSPIEITFIVDDLTPPGVRGVSNYSTVWGSWNVRSSGDYEVHLRRVEPFQDLQQPIDDDGFYMVGEDWDISAGQWKSLWPPGTIDNCYWARTNPNTGDIRTNHFGQAGVFVRIFDGDLFESDDCAPWVFIP